MNAPDRKTSALNRKAWLIVAFCCVYLGFQLFMIVRGHFVESKHFAFWMFPESTFFRASLSRLLIDGREVKTRSGLWDVKTENGLVEYEWQSFVKCYRLDRLETRERSKGTFDDTVKYFQAALDYVAERIPEDKTTYQLILTIRFQRAGGPEEVMVLESKPRMARSGKGRS